MEDCELGVYVVLYYKPLYGTCKLWTVLTM